MTTTRRILALTTLTLALILGTGLTANATYVDAAALPQTAVTTTTVLPPDRVRVDTSCTTTTTVIKRTYQTDPLTGTTTQVAYSQTTTTSSAKSNVESNTTSSAPGPGTNQYTTTQTIEDTMLYATLRWSPSTSTGVTGYRMTAFMSNGYSVGMGDATATQTSLTGQYDASVLNYNVLLGMVTLTSYGWTAPSALSNVVRC